METQTEKLVEGNFSDKLSRMLDKDLNNVTSNPTLSELSSQTTFSGFLGEFLRLLLCNWRIINFRYHAN